MRITDEVLHFVLISLSYTILVHVSLPSEKLNLVVSLVPKQDNVPSLEITIVFTMK